MDALDSCNALLSVFGCSVDGEALGIDAYNGLVICRFIVVVVVVGINGPGRIVARRRRKLGALNVWFAPWNGSGGLLASFLRSELARLMASAMHAASSVLEFWLLVPLALDLT
jgi:hypothetical protein